jgi:hypothetical protein
LTGFVFLNARCNRTFLQQPAASSRLPDNGGPPKYNVMRGRHIFIAMLLGAASLPAGALADAATCLASLG